MTHIDPRINSMNDVELQDPKTPRPAPKPYALSASHPPSYLPVIESDALLGTADQLLIRHNGQHYQLRRTRLGKLILTK
jgi:hemin uptake protein HemP